MHIHPCRKPWASALLVLLLATTTGCVRNVESPKPDAFPEVDAARMPGRPDCPDVSGVFSNAMQPGSDIRLADYTALAGKGASTFSFTRQGRELRMTSWWSPADVMSSARQLSSEDEQAYVRWWKAARDVLTAPMDAASITNASSLPGPTPVRVTNFIINCEDGWMLYASIAPTGAEKDEYGMSTLWLSRDRGGGLLLRNDVEVDPVRLALWGGDGVQGIRLYARRESRWARFPAEGAQPEWHVDFAALPKPEGADATAP